MNPLLRLIKVRRMLPPIFEVAVNPSLAEFACFKKSFAHWTRHIPEAA